MKLSTFGNAVLIPLFTYSPAAAAETGRTQASVTIAQNAVTADNTITYGGYGAGERIPVSLQYSGTCNVTFSALTLSRSAPFSPPKVVTGEVDNIDVTPQRGRATTGGIVTFDVRFKTLDRLPDGTRSGVVRLDLALGVDRDCDPSTGDSEGIDQTFTFRVQISVSSK